MLLTKLMRNFGDKIAISFPWTEVLMGQHDNSKHTKTLLKINISIQSYCYQW